MKRLKVQLAAAVIAAAMLLGGCGTEPYELTEKEEDIIVSYSSHIVSKYNAQQKEGLSYVAETETEEPSEEEERSKGTEAGDAPLPEDETMPEVPADDTEAGTETAQKAGFSELFGAGGVQVQYVGARISPNYVEDTYYALDARPGNVYLILGIDITNPGEAPVELNYQSMAPAFSAVVNGEGPKPAEITVLLDDFSTYTGTLGAGETVETVLLFQVPDTVQTVDALELYVNLNGGNYQINLENE